MEGFQLPLAQWLDQVTGWRGFSFPSARQPRCLYTTTKGIHALPSPLNLSVAGRQFEDPPCRALGLAWQPLTTVFTIEFDHCNGDVFDAKGNASIQGPPGRPVVGEVSCHWAKDGEIEMEVSFTLYDAP